MGIARQLVVINGKLDAWDDDLTKGLYEKQESALKSLPKTLEGLPFFEIPLRSYNVTGLDHVRALLKGDLPEGISSAEEMKPVKALSDVIDDLEKNGRKIIFTMGKGGVGKTTAAAAIAMGLARRGYKVHLTTTDPAAHVDDIVEQTVGLIVSRIDEGEALQQYRKAVLDEAKDNGLGTADIAYIEEDLRSPCTQEIAVFHAFADIVDQGDDQIVVIDTAPTGHTLLLLESTENYDKEIRRTRGVTPPSYCRDLKATIRKWSSSPCRKRRRYMKRSASKRT